ncbi:MAG TPA: copper homeostasis protein CutC [Pyrinomonadaceae bacterium]|nr:copper homeostasis protein CutC [Pyrinomonadaceae bacterium]
MQRVESTIQQPPLLEVIACSVADAIEAQRGGAGRLEVIRDFQRGGLTPPIELVAEILDAVTISVRVMVREGEDYEIDSSAEKEKLCAAARQLAGLNVDGIVLGFLNNGEIDVSLTELVLSCAPNLRATFHHAFEEAEDRLEAIKVLKRLNQVDRILASGGAGEWPEKIERLAQYQEAAGPEIKILAGGGIDQQSIRMLCEATDIREFHVGRAARELATATGVVQSDRVRALVEVATSLECFDLMQ